MMRQKKGTVFILVVLMSLLMVFIVTCVSNMILQDSHMVKRLKRSMQARYLAEAGISAAFAVLLDNGFAAKDTAGNFPLTTVSTGNTYDVTVVQSGGRVLLSSEGTASGTAISATAEVKGGTYPSGLENAMAAAGSAHIKSVGGNLTVKGNIHVNGALMLTENGSPTLFDIQAYGGYSGKATASGSYVASGNVVIADSTNSGGAKPPQTMLNLDFSALEAAAIANGNHISGNTTFNGGTINGGTIGLTFVSGNAKFQGTVIVNGGFVASGNLTLNNGNFLTQNHDAGNLYPVMACQGQLKFNGAFNTVEGNLVYSTNHVKIHTPAGSSTVVGCVMSGGAIDIEANGNCLMTYLKITASTLVPGMTTEIVSWNK